MDADHSLVSSGSPVSDRRGTDSCCARKRIGRRCCHSSLVRGSFWFAGSCLAEMVCTVWARATERVKTNQQKRANLNRGRRSRRCFCQGRRERQSAASDRERREKQKGKGLVEKTAPKLSKCKEGRWSYSSYAKRNTQWAQGQAEAEEEANLQEKPMAQQGKRWGSCQRVEQGKTRLLAMMDSSCEKQGMANYWWWAS